MNVSDIIPVLRAIAIWIIGLKVLPLTYPGSCSLCSLVASFIYSSSNSAIRTTLQIEIGPDCSERQLMNTSGWPRRNILELS